jgi:hypothetical protein
LLGEEAVKRRDQHLVGIGDVAVWVLVLFDRAVAHHLGAVPDAPAPGHVDHVQIVLVASVDHVFTAFGQEEKRHPHLVGHGTVHLLFAEDFEENRLIPPYPIGPAFEGDAGNDPARGPGLAGWQHLGGGVVHRLFGDHGGFVDEGFGGLVAGAVGQVNVVEGWDAVDVHLVFLREGHDEGGKSRGVGRGSEGLFEGVAGNGNGIIGQGGIVGLLDFKLHHPISRGGGSIRLELLGFGGQSQGLAVHGWAGFALVLVIVVGHHTGHDEVFARLDLDLPVEIIEDFPHIHLPEMPAAEFQLQFPHLIRVGGDFLPRHGFDEIHLGFGHGLALVVAQGERHIQAPLGQLGSQEHGEQDQSDQDGKEGGAFHTNSIVHSSDGRARYALLSIGECREVEKVTGNMPKARQAYAKDTGRPYLANSAMTL